MTATFVVNASPLICFAKADALGLLERVAAEVVVPEPVVNEILAGPPGDPARLALEGGWGRRKPGPHVPHRVLEWGLGAGESSVLALEAGRGMRALDGYGVRRSTAKRSDRRNDPGHGLALSGM